jgi:hypothetical protein
MGIWDDWDNGSKFKFDEDCSKINGYCPNAESSQGYYYYYYYNYYDMTRTACDNSSCPPKSKKNNWRSNDAKVDFYF